MRLTRLFKNYLVSVRQSTSLPVRTLSQTLSASVPGNVETAPGFINVEHGEGGTPRDFSSLPLSGQLTYRTDKLRNCQNQQGI
jgi:hypothetical protein